MELVQRIAQFNGGKATGKKNLEERIWLAGEAVQLIAILPPQSRDDPLIGHTRLKAGKSIIELVQPRDLDSVLTRETVLMAARRRHWIDRGFGGQIFA